MHYVKNARAHANKATISFRLRELFERRLFARRARAKQAVVFVTHVKNEAVRRHFLRLRSELKGLLDVFTCVFEPDQANNGDFPVDFEIGVKEAAHLLPTRVDQYRLRGANILPGYTDLTYLPALFRAELAACEFIWVMEYDVDYAGHWKNFFKRAMQSSADLIGTTIFPREQNRNWYHWPWFSSPPNVPTEDHLRSFLPIVRFSRRMIETYVEAVKDPRWTGHTEALYPTIAHHHGLVIEDLGGTGPFCPPAQRLKNYLNTPCGDLAPGTFVYRPVTQATYYQDAPQEFSLRDYLYHPIKANSAR